MKNSGLLDFWLNYNEAPHTKNSEDWYCPWWLTTDTSDHLAFAYQEQSFDLGEAIGPIVLASYSVSSEGKLATTSTYKDMPATGLSVVRAVSISPSDKLLAVGGDGFQVFHFNGSSPITKYSGVLQHGSSVEEFGWDKSNHLYVLTSDGLFVYTATTSKIEEVAFYSIQEANSLIVLDE